MARGSWFTRAFWRQRLFSFISSTLPFFLPFLLHLSFSSFSSWSSDLESYFPSRLIQASLILSYGFVPVWRLNGAAPAPYHTFAPPSIVPEPQNQASLNHFGGLASLRKIITSTLAPTTSSTSPASSSRSNSPLSTSRFLEYDRWTRCCSPHLLLMVCPKSPDRSQLRLQPHRHSPGSYRNHLLSFMLSFHSSTHLALCRHRQLRV